MHGAPSEQQPPHSGTRIPIARPCVGDLVESEPSHFLHVLVHTHADTQASTTFVVLRICRGSQISASPGHYLITADGCLRLVSHFLVHDQVRTANGEDYVVSVRHSIYLGLHNPRTASRKLLFALGTDARSVQASTHHCCVAQSSTCCSVALACAGNRTRSCLLGDPSLRVQQTLRENNPDLDISLFR